MTQHAGGGGWKTNRTSRRPRRKMAAGCSAVLGAVAFGACCVDVGHAFSSVLACPIDIFSCLGSDECSSCLDRLQDAGLTIGGIDFELCGELYADVCVTADSVGCNTENAELVDLLTCVAEDQFGCDDFTTCEAATATLVEATEAPATAAPSTAPATPAPSIATTIVTPTATPTTPILPPPTAAPSPGSRGSISVPTAAPTADGSAAASTPFPSPALFEETAQTMAPSESSAAPTGIDGLRGSMLSVTPTAAPTGFEGPPTAAPTGFEGPGDLEDSASGGISSRHTPGAAAWSIVLAVILAGSHSLLAASGN